MSGETAASAAMPAVAAASERTAAGLRRRRILRWIGARAELATGVGILLALLLASFLVPALSRNDPNALSAQPLLAPTGAHLFGTDDLGRDMFVRVFAAIQVDLGITLVSVLLSLAIGVVVGMVIGFSPRWLAEVLQRCVDALISIPYLIFVLAIVAFTRTHTVVPLVPPSVGAILLALVVVGWPNYARITAAQTRVLLQRESIVAVRLLGYSTPRVVMRHIVPEVLSPNISLAGSHAAITTATVASLAFLGAGVAPPTAELGVLMQEGTALIQSSWWVSIYPGLAILALGAGFSLIADARSE